MKKDITVSNRCPESYLSPHENSSYVVKKIGSERKPTQNTYFNNKYEVAFLSKYGRPGGFPPNPVVCWPWTLSDL